ncbi:MAG: aminotransferase class I/II-fold pyridoxal phosphate-dependent enzyme [Eubacteriales bacterium]
MTWKEKAELLERELTFKHLLEVLCVDKSRPFAIWLEGDEVKSYNYGTLENKVFACAENITNIDFGKKGGWTAIAVDTCMDWPVLFWGLLASGRNALLLDPSLEDGGIDHLMKEAGADALITRKIRNLPYAQKTPEEVLGNSQAPSATYKADWADMIAVCTSGTTTTSRVYVYNGEAVCRQVLGFVIHQSGPTIMSEKNAPMPSLAFLPMNHVFGLLTNVINTPFLDAPQVFLKDRSPQTIFETCQKAKVKMLLTVPLLINSISTTIQKKVAAEKPIKRFAFKVMKGISLTCQRISPNWGLNVGKKLFKSVNKHLFGDSMMLLVCGGAHVPMEHMKMVNALGYAVTVGFGMTETAITSYENKVDLKSRISGSVGLPLSITQYKILPDGDNPNRGELLVKCNAMHIGRLSGSVLLPPAVDEEGWFHTGDIARIGKKGRMWIEGRCKDVIIGESGENVYPDELEDTFAGIEGVEQLTILGINKNKDELITMVINVGDNYNNDAFLSKIAAEIDKRNRTLRPLKRVRLVYATPEPLPTASRIKVKRGLIKKEIEQGTFVCKQLSITGSPVAFEMGKVQSTPQPKKPEINETEIICESPSLESIKQKIKECFADELLIDAATISDDASFTDDIECDSLHRLGALMRIENELGVIIPEESYEYCQTVSDLASVILSLTDTGEVKVCRKAEGEVTPITDFTQSPEYKEFAKRFECIGSSKNPYFICHESPLKDTSLMSGKEVLNFGSYNYVGMSGRKEVNEAAKAAIDKYGTSASGSRLLAGEKELYQVLEKEIAQWKHAEAALVLVGGHSTNVTVVGNFCGKKDLIVYDALSHNSIHEGCRLSDAVAIPFPHNDYVALDNLLKTRRSKYEKVLIVVEGAYSMDGDIAPIPEIVAIKKKYGCFLMVDEAHSACVIGKTGGGVDEYFDLDPNDIDIKMGTLSKGLGACGGYIAGRRELIEYMRYNIPGFVFSVGISPALAAAVLESIRLLRSNPSIIEDLHRNISVFMEEARKRSLNTCLAGETAIIPVLVGEDTDAFALSNRLYELGVFVPPAVFPAVPKGQARLRFCVISDHKPEQISKALDLLVQAADELGIKLPSPDDVKAKAPVSVR